MSRAWWRHQMETFSALLALCAGNSDTGPGEFPAQRPVTQNFDVFFDLRPNKRLSNQAWSWWFETPSWSWWRQCNGFETPARYNVWIKGCVSSSTFGMGCYWQVQTKWERYVNILAITFILNFLPLMSNIIRHWMRALQILKYVERNECDPRFELKLIIWFGEVNFTPTQIALSNCFKNTIKPIGMIAHFTKEELRIDASVNYASIGTNNSLSPFRCLETFPRQAYCSLGLYEHTLLKFVW